MGLYAVAHRFCRRALCLAQLAGLGVMLAALVGASERESPAYLPLSDVPPSPSQASAERIWPDPHLTHWPPLIYDDESRNAALTLPIREAGVAGWWGWQNGPRIPFTLPQQAMGDQTAGLIGIPQEVGRHQGQVVIADHSWPLALRVIDVDSKPWPHQGLENGFPVDAEGVPVVVRLRRQYGQGDRRWIALRGRPPAGQGPALFIGDPLLSLGRGVIDPVTQADDQEALPSLVTHFVDSAHPSAAGLVAWAQWQHLEPRLVVWSPGNRCLESRLWTAEELRFMEAINQSVTAAGYQPRAVLLLPPLPVEQALRERAHGRLQALRYHATRHGWEVLDGEAIAGRQGQGAELSPGLYLRYPHGAAQDALREKLESILSLE